MRLNRAAVCLLVAVTGSGLICAKTNETFGHRRLWAEGNFWQWSHELSDGNRHVETERSVMHGRIQRHVKLIKVGYAANDGQMPILRKNIGHAADGSSSEYGHSQTPKIGFTSERRVQFSFSAIVAQYLLAATRDLLVAQGHHEIPDVEGWRRTGNFDSETGINLHPFISAGERHVRPSLWTEPWALSGNQGLFSRIGGTCSGIRSFLVGAVHEAGEYRINGESQENQDFQNKLGFPQTSLESNFKVAKTFFHFCGAFILFGAIGLAHILLHGSFYRRPEFRHILRTVRPGALEPQRGLCGCAE